MNRADLLHLQKTFLKISNLSADQYIRKGVNATKEDLKLVHDYNLLMKLIDEQVNRNLHAAEVHAKRPSRRVRCENISFREKLIKGIWGNK